MSRQVPDSPRQDQISELLDAALREALVEASSPALKVRVRRLRSSGIASLLMAAACVFALALVPLARTAVGSLVLTIAALALLMLGGWLVDRAGADEIQAQRDMPGSELRIAFVDSPDIPLRAKIRRRRYFGISMLVLSGFGVSVTTLLFPANRVQDAATWAAFSVSLILVGAWQIGKARKESLREGELSTAGDRRESAKSGEHIRRVK
jgi:hypothetical protein